MRMTLAAERAAAASFKLAHAALLATAAADGFDFAAETLKRFAAPPAPTTTTYTARSFSVASKRRAAGAAWA